MTLIALVVTIIIMILLAGISIHSVTDNGLFGKARLARKENERGGVAEWLTLKVTEVQAEYGLKNQASNEEIIKAVHDRVVEKQDELKEYGTKDIEIKDVSAVENFEETKPYFHVIVDEDLYKVDITGGYLIGPMKEQTPSAKVKEATNTSNSITVKVDTEKNEGGKIEYYIKGKDEDDSKYKLVKTKKDDENGGKEYTFEGLEDNKEYTIKIVVIGENGKKTETIINKITKEVTSLTKENIIFEYDPTSEWTNKDVKVTAKVREGTDLEGFTLRTSKDGENWIDGPTQTYTENGTMYVVLWDGVNYGGAATTEITNIDKTAPTKPTINLNGYTNGNWTNKDVTITANSTDSGSGISCYQYSYNKKDIAGTITNSYKISNAGKYTIYIRPIDKAGNIGDWSDEISIKITKSISITNVTLREKKNGIYYTYNGNFTYNDVYITLSLDSEALDHYEYSYDGSNVAGTFTDYLMFNSLKDKYVYFRAVDKVGQYSTWTKGYRLKHYNDYRGLTSNINVNKDNYTVEIRSLNPGQTIWYPTWTDNGGQDDLKWYTKTADSNGNVTVRVNISDHNYEKGEYETDFYVYESGKQVMFGAIQINFDLY